MGGMEGDQQPPRATHATTQVFTPLVEVQEASKLPFIIASLSQIMNGVTFVGEV